MELIFEKSTKGKRCASVRSLRVPTHSIKSKFCRNELDLPEVAEIDMVRHYTALAGNTFGVDNGFYPLGSCTMKYNPKLNEECAAMEGFCAIHPLQPAETIQGCLEAMDILQKLLIEITGMDGISLQPQAGAQGEFCALMMIDKYHKSRKDNIRNKIIVPDSAHGTNPASVTMAGFEVVNIPSDSQNGVDLDALRQAVGEDTAAMMLTNPTTVGLFEKNIKEIEKIVHDAGGLMYYDGANLNAVMGIVRPADMGFDIVHLNLHKTFSTPHGGGGPGSGPIGCKESLMQFLPVPYIARDKRGEYRLEVLPDGKNAKEGKQSIGRVSPFYGNFAINIRALAYILTLGADGIKESAQHAVLNANYLKSALQDIYPTQKDRYCMHEFVVSLKQLKQQTGVSAADVAKALMDYGIHPPTMYFPLIIEEALMIEPTETESKQTLDRAIEIFKKIYKTAQDNPQEIKDAPKTTIISRPDEVSAARQPKLRF